VLNPILGNAAVESRVRDWTGYPEWRRVINAANEPVTPPNLLEDLFLGAAESALFIDTIRMTGADDTPASRAWLGLLEGRNDRQKSLMPASRSGLINPCPFATNMLKLCARLRNAPLRSLTTCR
jgi:hypothetical protein